jgi:diguanylate cyclase
LTFDTTVFVDFEAAARAVLAFLHQSIGLELWIVTRSDGDDCIVLHAEDHDSGGASGAEAGRLLRWPGPLSARNGAQASAEGGGVREMRPCATLPLYRPDGSLFGTLCGIDSMPRELAAAEQALIELLGGMLNKVLQAELIAGDDARRIERLEAEALTDALTDTYNRRCWDRLLSSEEERCRRHGHPAAILMIDLDGLKQINDTHGHAAGDALLVRAGAALRHAVRPHDVVARLGGDEFGILSVECDRRCGEALLTRVQAALAEANVPASIGLAVRNSAIGLLGAWEDADQYMYEAKRAH